MKALKVKSQVTIIIIMFPDQFNFTTVINHYVKLRQVRRSSCQLVVNFVHYLFVSEEEKQYSSIDDKSKNAEKCQVDAANIEYLERYLYS